MTVLYSIKDAKTSVTEKMSVMLIEVMISI